jgi:predicted nucleic acid-binding protein
MTKQLFVDTNLFIRYITNDIPEQADAFEKLIKMSAAGECHLITNSLVIAEIVWTLESYYRLTKTEIQQRVLFILNTPGLDIPGSDILHQAALWYAEKNIDFIDAFNAAWMISREIPIIATFDRKHFARITEIEVRVPGE